jgi:hypothetical protein
VLRNLIRKFREIGPAVGYQSAWIGVGEWGFLV